jgi:ketosteroid isomerase-like protein
MSRADREGFLVRFAQFGRDPTPGRYLDLFDAEGTVQHPGMPRPLAGQEIAGFIATALSAMPDFRLRPLRWCARDDTLFVEAACSATVRGAHIIWPAIYCVTLREDRVIRGRSYYDRAAILSRPETDAVRGRRAHATAFDTEADEETNRNDNHLDLPDIRANLVEPYIDNWRDPQPERFADFYAPSGRLLAPGIPTSLSGDDIVRHYRTELAQMDELHLHCTLWAARSRHVFFEWRMTGSVSGRPFDIGAAERLTLDGYRIAESASYFDTLSFEAVRDPSVVAATVFEAAR